MIILPVPPPPDSILYSDPLRVGAIDKTKPGASADAPGFVFFINWSDPLCLFCPGGNAEQHKADNKQDGNGANAHVGAAS
mgnify:CR=1 FL=1